MSHRPPAPIAWCLASAALFGGSTPAAKALLGAVDPLVLAGLLYVGAALGVLPFAARRAPRRADAANVRRLAGAVLFGGVLGPALLVYGLARAPSASVSLWLNLETVATAVLGALLFREHIGPRVWLASGLVVGAGVLLAAPDGFQLAPAAILVAGACLCWGLDNNLTAVVDGFTPEQTTLAKGAVAGPVNLALGAWLGGDGPDGGSVAGALAVGALGYGVSIALYIRGAQHLGATRAQVLFATAPFLGVLAAWGVLGEPVLPVQLIAGALLSVGVVLVLGAAHHHLHAHAAEVHTHVHRHDDGHHDHDPEGLPPGAWHTHEHVHEALVHEHPHTPDLHHRHH
jgi:drug/metabolite transporter (DMT)-like permease